MFVTKLLKTIRNVWLCSIILCNFANKFFLTMQFSHDSIASAYAFFHQKWRVYSQSQLAWQQDDIEYAISSYVVSMDPNLYSALSKGRTDFLKSHTTFAADMVEAIDQLESLLGE